MIQGKSETLLQQTFTIERIINWIVPTIGHESRMPYFVLNVNQKAKATFEVEPHEYED